MGAAQLSGLAAQCAGYEVVVTLSGPGGVALAEVTAVVQGERMGVGVPVAVSAEQLTGVSVVLTAPDA